MTVSDLLLPVFVQVGLTFFLMFWMGAAAPAGAELRRGEADDIALRQPALADRVRRRSPTASTISSSCRCCSTCVVAFILITSTNSLIFVLLAWIFVLARLVHAYIHTGANDVRSRSMAIGVGAIALVAMWVIFAIRILVTGA